jgi:hypothetical protein
MEPIEFILFIFTAPIIFSIRVARCFHVHIDEVNIYSRDHKNAFTFRTKGGSSRRGSKPAKFARVVLRVFSLTDCSSRRGVQ